jgi:hypothetical protein
MSTTPTVLRVRTETIHEVDCFNLEQFVKEQYPDAKPYSFVADQECGNDSVHRFRVSKESLLQDYDRRRVEDFAAGKRVSGITGALLDDLCRRGLIEPGTYVVSVCW